MKSKWTSIVVLSLLCALAMPVCMTAQDNLSLNHNPKHHHYKLVDLGTFGGPSSYVPALLASINSRGSVIVEADTTIPDPNCPNNCWNDGVVNHPGIWQDGVLTDLGALPGVNSAGPQWVNDRGMVVGGSQNGVIDPLNGIPAVRAVVWKDGQVIDLGSFGGYESSAQAINNRGQVTGIALNTILDPFESSLGPPNLFCCGVTQMHAFLWQHGPIQDLGTLGGPDSAGIFLNERGQVAGVSYTSFVANQGTGIPTEDPFLWDDGTMKDLGTLGGTEGWPYGLNSRGQVTGQSNLTGDTQHHAFLWDRGGLKDLGTLGGDNSSARWVNDAGEVVGRADLYPGLVTRHGFLWKNGAMIDLGVPAGGNCGTAYAINSSEQIVGDWGGICGGASNGFLWENGGPIVDLQTLVLPGSDVTISETNYINDAGEISGFGMNSNGDTRAIVLIPCDDHHPGECEDNSLIDAPTPQAGAPALTRSQSTVGTDNASRNRFGRGLYNPGQAAELRN